MRALLLLLLGMLQIPLQAQEQERHHWSIPDHIPLQYAGNIGFVSTGFGYSILKDKAEIDFMFGYVPKDVGGPLSILTNKFTWLPLRPTEGKEITFDLLTAGGYLSYSLGDAFFFIPNALDKYPAGYYDYSSALRVGIFVGGRMHYWANGKTIPRITLYYEVGTYD